MKRRGVEYEVVDRHFSGIGLRSRLPARKQVGADARGLP